MCSCILIKKLFLSGRMQPTSDPVNNVEQYKERVSSQWHANLTPEERMARQERERGILRRAHGKSLVETLKDDIESCKSTLKGPK